MFIFVKCLKANTRKLYTNYILKIEKSFKAKTLKVKYVTKI